MRKLFLFAAIVFLGACARRHPPVVAPQAGPATVKPQARLADVLPRPAVLEPRDGEFVVTPQTVIAADRSNADVARVADMVAQYIKRASGLAVKPSSGAAASTISLSITAGENPEAYQITVAPDRISVVGSGPAGLFYGFQTLRQLMPVAGEYEALLFQQPRPFAIPAVHIADEPRFEWRGAMLDVARHFFSVDDVKRYVDLLALHKMNRLHLHLADDQGWRIEIKSRPALTGIGAATEVGGTPGGYYTQQQFADLVAYADARFVTIVPEIDMPGHTNAALSAYPELNCNGTSPPMWMYGPGVIAANSRITSSTNRYVISLPMHSELYPTSVSVRGGGATPSQVSSGYATCAAFTCPGMSISGTIVTYRAAA